ncbi:MAG: YbhB/YbcL family Raf kinase inhibitor-like protein [Candidatus Gracilibacteria bacterium]|nr:YbhB/YbcL family Raf kinase inhibitor-like protein [Candidatus Gracilibacteria bacterium]MDD2908564.1 YbhB/YbcL family Raf kinase inhibitor-like protein [Candidatus Gracilibacteria bacterium]
MENTLKITSVFENNSFIPEVYSCNGRDINPEFKIGNIPNNTKSLALIMDDPDAPAGTFVHWVAWNIPASNIEEESSRFSKYSEGINSASVKGYIGPCPPIGHGVHHYHFKVFALDTTLDLVGNVDKEKLLKEMTGHILSSGEIVGLFERK